MVDKKTLAKINALHEEAAIQLTIAKDAKRCGDLLMFDICTLKCGQAVSRANRLRLGKK